MLSHARLFAAMCMALFLLAGCDNQPNKADAGRAPGVKIGVVDPEKIFQESKTAKAGVAFLDSVSKDLQQQLTALQTETSKMKDPQEGQAKLQQGLNDMQQRFSAEQQQVMAKVSDIYQKSLDNCRETEKFDLILGRDVALSLSPSLDITAKVIEAMDRTSVTFEPLTPPASQNATAPAKAAGQNATMPAKPASQNATGNATAR